MQMSVLSFFEPSTQLLLQFGDMGEYLHCLTRSIRTTATLRGATHNYTKITSQRQTRAFPTASLEPEAKHLWFTSGMSAEKPGKPD